MTPFGRVADYMTPSSHFTGTGQCLSIASDRMHRLNIRNLPVVQGGILCGVLTEQDLTRAGSLSSDKFARLSVGDAMGEDVYAVAESTPLAHVVRTMATHGYGCAVVMERGSVIGVFGTHDALRALSAALDAQHDDHSQLGPSEVRTIILSEHSHVDTLLLRAQTALYRLHGSRDVERDARHARERAHHLLQAIRAYLELEDRALTPMLSELHGSSKALGQKLAEEHIRQLADSSALVSVLDDATLSSWSLGEQLGHLITNLKRDLEREHALLLVLDSVSNDGVISDAAAD